MHLDFDRTKSLRELEVDAWRGYSTEEGLSPLERRAYRLSGVPLSDFSTHDLRFFLRQGLSLGHIVPVAIDALIVELWTPGCYPPGLLLSNVVLYMEEFWRERPDLWRAPRPVLDRAVSMMPTLDETTYNLMIGLLEESDGSELELIIQSQRNHRAYLLQYLGLEYNFEYNNESASLNAPKI